VATAPSSKNIFQVTDEVSLQYNIVLINLGEVWSHTHNAATIAVPGIYYTVVNMGISCVQDAAYWLRVNKENVFKVILSSGVRRTQTNGAVIRLDVRDTLTVTMVSPLRTQCYHFSSNSITSFFGILLSPDNYI
jgi:hypothetical protein